MFNQYPYLNFNDLNLDYILNAIKVIQTELENFVSINAIKYANPIQWNITSQYEKNTIVIDPQTGTAYISVAAVPSGVTITNTSYWSVVFDLSTFVVKTAKNFTSNYEDATTLTATMALSVNDWVIWGDTLYYVISPITAGDQYVINSNIAAFTIENVVGHIQDLATTDKSNLVAAINELLQLMQTLSNNTGELSDLDTSDKTSIVNAINEVINLALSNSKNIAGVNYHFPAPHVVSGYSDGVGNCCIIEHNDKYYLVDCFTAYQFTNYALPYLNNLGVSEIEKVFITHYHADHCGGVTPLLASNISVKEFVLAPEPDWTETAFWTAEGNSPQADYNTTIAAIIAADVSYVFATNNEIDLGDGLVVTPYNTDYSPYYSMTTARPSGNTTNDSDDGIYADYNNLSVLFKFTKNNTNVFFLSDANYTCLQNNLTNFTKCAMITIPHHDHNTFVDTDAMKLLNPDIAVTQDTANEHGFTLALIYRQCAKYLTVIGCQCYITFGEDIVINTTNYKANAIIGSNHRGYYDEFVRFSELTKWLIMENPFDNIIAHVADADTLEPGVDRLSASSTNIPLSGTGFLIITFRGQDSNVKLQFAVANLATAQTYFRSAGNNSTYTAWQKIDFNNLFGDSSTGVYDADSLPIGTYRLSASSTNTPIAGYGYMITTFISDVNNVKLQIAVINGNEAEIFIRSAGNNNSYNAWTRLFINPYNNGDTISSNADLNDFTTPGVYNCPSGTVAATLTNSPVTNAGFRLEVFLIGSGLGQKITSNNTTVIWHERRYASMNTWGAWTQTH